MTLANLFLRKRITGFEALIFSVAFAGMASRFIGLGYTPPPLAMDEALGAAHIGCLGSQGTSADGNHWPLFAYGFGGGFYTPVFLYFGLLWTKVFGLSIPALRGIPAVFVTATIFGLWAVATRLGGKRLGLWALLAASLSPWGFHYARVAWDPPLAPAFLIWCVYFWLVRSAGWGGALSGAMFAGAIYSYPPMRLQAPLVFACLFVMTFRWRIDTAKRTCAFLASSVALSLPLLKLILAPEFMGRSSHVSIFTPAYINGNRGEYGALEYFIFTYLDNLAMHLRPSFLFFTGDSILRHSPHHFGELGWLDAFALLCVLGMVARRLFGRQEGVRSTQALSSAERRPLALSLFGVFFGLSAAALTWESIPHATRALGAWPFFALLTATLLSLTQRSWPRLVRWGAPVVGIAFALAFGRYYFTDYVPRARESFALTYYVAALKKRAAAHRDDSDLSLYLLMSRNTMDCGR